MADAEAASGPNNGAALDLGRQALDQWTRGLFEYGDELGRFAVARFNERMEASRNLAHCRNVGEAVTCESNFLQKAWTDYSAQAAKQFQFWTTLAENALAMGPAIAMTARSQPNEEKTWNVGSSAVVPAQERRPLGRESKASTTQPAGR